MTRCTQYARRRALRRGAGWSLAVLLIVALLYGANRFLPVRLRSPERRRIHVRPPRVDQGRVSGVADGDTLYLEGGIAVRLKDIDTPEKDQPGYEGAKAALRRLVDGRSVRLAYGTGDPVDRYGRLLAYVHLPEGRCVNEVLLAEGWGWIYRPEEAALPRLLELQRAALSQGKGVWKYLEDRTGPFTGNRSSRVFHRPLTPCGRSVAPRNRCTLRSLSEAFCQGFSPCRSCFSHPLEGR